MTQKTVAASIHSEESRATMNEQGVFTYGNDTLYYDVIRRTQPADSAKKAARKVIIKVHPDKRVVATVPHDAGEEAIQEAMHKRARWIWQSINEFAKQKDTVLHKRYVSGETQFYLGKRYVLKINIDAEQVPNVKLSRGKLNVTIKHDISKNNDDRLVKIKPLIDKWYQHKAKAIFHERLAELLPKTTWITGIPSFRVMAMKKQWGS